MPKILISSFNSEPVTYQASLTSVGLEYEAFYCPVIKGSELALKYPENPVIAPADFDGLLLCGGGDMDPSFFHQENQGSAGIDIPRDETELALFHAFYAAGKPILGICRGHQVINVALGGDLIQHIGDDLCHFHTYSKDHQGDKAHAVVAAEDSWFHKTFGRVFIVNSSHHQAVGKLGKGLSPVLWSETKIVEAVEHESYPLISVQFHPERMMCDQARPDTVSGAPVFERFAALFQ